MGGRGSISQRRAKEIVEQTGGDRMRRGATDRLEVGHDGLHARTGGTCTVQVENALSERIGGTHVTRARRVERTVRGGVRIDGRADTILLGGAMSEVHAGAELVVAGMSDELLLGAGTRITAPLDLWLTGIIGLEDKLASATFDGAIIDTARTLFESESRTGVHHAASATFTGAVYATQATGFFRLMKVSSGVRNLSSGGGGGSGDGESSSSGPSPAGASPDSGSEPGLLGSARTPAPASAGSDATDLGRVSENARSAEDATLYTRTENVADTASDLQEAARRQAAGDAPDDAAGAPSRMESADVPSAGSSPGQADGAAPNPVHPDAATPPPADAQRGTAVWAPPSTRKRTYTKGQVPVGGSFNEFDFDAVVGTRPDKLLSDDAQASMDTAAFRVAYDARNDVTDMAHRLVLRADPNLAPEAVSDMSAVEARQHLAALQSSAAQANDIEGARRFQDLLNELDHYAFDIYAAAIGEAEALHDTTPMKLGSHIDAKSLEQHLTSLADAELERMNDTTLSDAERNEAGKLASAYMMAAQDTAQGLDPMAHIQEVLNSGLEPADAHLYTQAASQISAARAQVSGSIASVPAARSLWARSDEVASALLSLAGPGSNRVAGPSLADELIAAGAPVRFVDDPPGTRPRFSGRNPGTN